VVTDNANPPRSIRGSLLDPGGPGLAGAGQVDGAECGCCCQQVEMVVVESWDQGAPFPVDDINVCRAGDKPRLHGDDAATTDGDVGAYSADLDIV
jgi:hypothetical protein